MCDFFFQFRYSFSTNVESILICDWIVNYRNFIQFLVPRHEVSITRRIFTFISGIYA